MNKTYTLILISIAATFVGVAPSLASEPEAPQVIAMGTQPAPVIVDDAAIQKAIESIIKQQQIQAPEIKNRIPSNKLDNPISEHPLRNRNSDKMLILGGSEIVPM